MEFQLNLTNILQLKIVELIFSKQYEANTANIVTVI